jgi:probable HAF family extracellular repeat protein
MLTVGVAGCSDASPPTQPGQLTAHRASAPVYVVSKLTGLGGTGTSQGGGINNRGWVAGYSARTDGIRHAALWQGTTVTDLGTLGGATSHSSAQWPGVNNRGTVVGISQTGVQDPLQESWSCSAFLPANGQSCLGFVWQAGVLRALPTLGGNNGFAAGVNNRGQVVGWAETPVHDPTCQAPQVLQFRAVLWDHGHARQLRPLHGDSTSAATAINQRGQVVGISGACDVSVGRFSATHAVLWEPDGSVVDLGSLGGVGWHTPMAINERGDVVGFSNPPDGDLNADSLRAFLWTRERGMQDLGRLPGDQYSQALDINNAGQIVGVSCAAVCHAVLWQDGSMIDLQTLAAPGFTDILWSARGINDAGQITGRLRDTGLGRFVAFVAKPQRGEQ